MEEPVRLVLPKSWEAGPGPVALERLADQDWIVGSRQPDDRQIAERACALAGFAPRIAHTVDDYDLLLRMVAAGFGVGFAPDLALQSPSAEAVTVRTATGPPLSRQIHALTRTTLAASPLVDALLSELAEAG
jgi:DNA-binding transcriptional LysR family regulator